MKYDESSDGQLISKLGSSLCPRGGEGHRHAEAGGKGKMGSARCPFDEAKNNHHTERTVQIPF